MFNLIQGLLNWWDGDDSARRLRREAAIRGKIFNECRETFKELSKSQSGIDAISQFQKDVLNAPIDGKYFLDKETV